MPQSNPQLRLLPPPPAPASLLRPPPFSTAVRTTIATTITPTTTTTVLLLRRVSISTPPVLCLQLSASPSSTVPSPQTDPSLSPRRTARSRRRGRRVCAHRLRIRGRSVAAFTRIKAAEITTRRRIPTTGCICADLPWRTRWFESVASRESGWREPWRLLFVLLRTSRGAEPVITRGRADSRSCPRLNLNDGSLWFCLQSDTGWLFSGNFSIFPILDSGKSTGSSMSAARNRSEAFAQPSSTLVNFEAVAPSHPGEFCASGWYYCERETPYLYSWNDIICYGNWKEQFRTFNLIHPQVSKLKFN